MAFKPNETEVLYDEDIYDHVSEGLIYVTSCCFGSATIKEEIMAPIFGCGCNSSCEDYSCTCLYPEKILTAAAVDSVIAKRHQERFESDIPIFECHSDCSCSKKSCANRIVQKGPLRGLEIRRTTNKGFGVFTAVDIPKGKFVCEYAGEIISVEEAKRRISVLDADSSNYILVLKEYFANGTQITVVDPGQYRALHQS